MSWLAVWFAGLFLGGVEPSAAISSEPADPPVEEASDIKFGGGTVSGDRPVVSPR